MPEHLRPALVVTALREELAPILRAVPVSTDRVEGRRVFRAEATAGPPLILAVTGDGSGNARRWAGRLCEVYRPTALVGLGVAGALTLSLSPMDLVSSARLRNGSGDAPAADEFLLRLAMAAGARPATLVTAMAPVVSVAGRKALAEGAGDVAAVDMESAAWARAAASMGVPFVVVRAILDGAEEELPDYLPECVGSDGGIHRGSVLVRSLLRPSTIPALLRMRRRVAECGNRLATFLLDRFFAS